MFVCKSHVIVKLLLVVVLFLGVYDDGRDKVVVFVVLAELLPGVDVVVVSVAVVT